MSPLPHLRAFRAIRLSAAALLIAGCPAAKPTVDIKLDPSPLDGTLLESRAFDIWLIAKAGDGKPAEETKVGVMLERRARHQNETLRCEERKTVSGRGQVLISTWQKTVFAEDSAGRPLRFSFEKIQDPGRNVSRYEGVIEGNKLRLTTGEGPAKRTKMLDRPADAATLPALERALLAKGLDTLAVNEGLQARVFPVPEEPEKPHTAAMGLAGKETVQAGGKTIDVFAIREVVEVFGAAIARTSYMNAAGETYRIEEKSGVNRIIYRRTDGPAAAVAAAIRGAQPDEAPAAVAGTPGKAGVRDVLAESMIPVDKPVPLKAPSARFRITAGEALADLPETGQQKFVRESDTAGIVTVTQAKYPTDSKEQIGAKHGTEMDRYLKPSRWLESDDPGIWNFAHAQLRGDQVIVRNALAAAKKLERGVNAYIRNKTLEVAFASARETLISRKGDCTEHAVLLAAAARAVGLPSRVVGGIVYADQFVGHKQVFSYHMWTEIFISGAWYPFDAALFTRGGFEVGHVALAVNDMAALRSDLELDLSLRKAVGKLKVEVLDPAR